MIETGWDRDLRHDLRRTIACGRSPEHDLDWKELLDHLVPVCLKHARLIYLASAKGMAQAQPASAARAEPAPFARADSSEGVAIPPYPDVAATAGQLHRVVEMHSELVERVAELERWRSSFKSEMVVPPSPQPVTCATCRGFGTYGTGVCPACKGAGVHRV